MPEKIYRTGIYTRLSQEDKEEDESNSITSQKAICMEYISCHPDLELAEIYDEDDGYTGINMDRPGFQRMLWDVQTGKINCIISKDLSRFSRNYIDAGNYLEKVFPFLGIRYIAVNDAYDSLMPGSVSDGIILPLKNLVNEYYARDISKKVRSAKKILRKKGCFLGTYAMYGYEKTKDKHRIQIDPEAAGYVKMIFDLGEQGISDSAIAKYLNQHQIACPSKYKYEKGILKNKKYASTSGWYPQTVAGILTSRIYIGDMVQGRRINREIKGKREVAAQSEWDIVPGTHEAIISKEQFERVQEIRQDRHERYQNRLKKKTIQTDEPEHNSILRGKIYCGDCKKAMTRKHIKTCKDRYRYICDIYERNGQCSRKFLPEQDVYQLLNYLLKKQIEMVYGSNEWMRKTQRKKDCAIFDFEKRLRKNKEKREELIRKKASLYRQWKEGMIEQKEYFSQKLYCDQDISRYEEEKGKLMRSYEECKIVNITEYSVCERKNNGKEKFLHDIRLSKELVECLIDRIEVYENCRVKVCVKFMDGMKQYGKR